MSEPQAAAEGAPFRPLSSSLATACLFVLAHGLVVAAFMLLVRQNLHGGHTSVGAATLHLGALIGGVLLGPHLADLYRPSFRLLSLALGALVSYLLPLLGWAFGPATLLFPGLLTAAGVYLLVRLMLDASPWIFFWACLGGALSGTWAAVTLNAEPGAHVLSYEFTILGWQAADPVFHAAIAALLQTYHTFTVGVDGTVPIFYHMFTHVVAAGMAYESGEVLPFVYPAFQQVFILPALILGTSAAVTTLYNASPARSLVIPFIIILYWMAYEWIGAYNSFLLSESYAFALGLLSFGSAYIVYGIGIGAVPLLLWVAVSGLLVAVVVASKFTLALVGIALLGYGLSNYAGERSGRLRSAILLLTGFVFFGTVVLLLYLLNFREVFEWFGYARHLRRLFEISILAMILGAVAAPLGRRLGLRTPPWYAIVLLCLGLHIPDSLVFAGSGEYYWFHPGDHIASLVVVAVSASILGWVAAKLSFSNLVWAPLLVLACGAILFSHTFPRALSTLATTLRAFDKLAEVGRGPTNSSLLPGVRSHEAARAFLSEHGGSALSGTLSAIPEAFLMIGRTASVGISVKVEGVVNNLPLAKVSRRLASHARPDQALLLSPENEWYWSENTDCLSRPFRIQSLTGIALIAGLPRRTERCQDSKAYGLALSEDARNRELDNGVLCAAAARHRFTRVAMISGPDEISFINCGYP